MQQYRMMDQTQLQIPDDVARMAHEQKLGALQGDCKILKLARGWRWLYLTTIFLLGVFLILWICAGILIFLVGSETALNMSNSLLAYAAGIALLSAVFVVPLAIKCAYYHIYLSNKGFVIKQSTKFHIFHWDEVEEIWCSSTHVPNSFIIRHHIYKIRCHDGYTLTFSSGQKSWVDLNNAIYEQFTQRQLPTYFANYEAGQTLDFGPLSISRNGVNAHSKTLSWEQIAKVSLLKDRRLVIARAGDEQRLWLNVQAFKVPNLMVLLALIERIRTGQVTQEKHAQATEAPIAYGTNTTLVLAARREVSPLPDEIAALADEYQLGERRTDDRLRINRIVTWPTIIGQFILTIIMILFTNWMCSWMFSWLTVPYMPEWITILENDAKIVFLLIVGIDCLFKIFPWITHVNHCIYVFAHGLIFKHGRSAPVVCCWNDIEEIRLAYKNSSNQTSETPVSAHTLQMRDGEKYTLSSLDINQRDLGKIIQEQVAPLQLSRSLAAYHEGQTLAFGSLRINQQGIALNAQQLPWLEVKSARLEGNALVIYDITQRKPWCKLPAARVPNLSVFFALTDAVRENAALPTD